MVAQADVLTIKVPPFEENVFVVTDKAYGASTGASAAKNTAAINLAISDAVKAGGGVVFIPAGSYKIQPTTALTANGYALWIGGNNVTIRGAGRTVTKLTFYVYGGLDPATNFELRSGTVQRGYGISLATGVKNFTLEGLEFAGMPTLGSGYTNNPAFPANTTTGDGWDITHKAVFAQNDATIDNVRIRDCYIHDWRGEIIYYGGTAMGRMTVEDCELGYTNGDCLSVTGQCTYRRNELHHAAYAAIEDVYAGVPETIEDNYIHDCLNGINLSAQNGLTSWALASVKRNRMKSCTRDGIVLNHPQNVAVHDNLVVDCGTTTNFYSIRLEGTGGTAGALRNVSICRNVILALNVDIWRGLLLYDATLGLTDAEVRDNVFLLASGRAYSSIDMFNSLSSTLTRVEIRGNRRSGSTSTPVKITGVNYTADVFDETIIANVGFETITIPAATGLTGKRYTVKRGTGSTGAVTVQAATGTIDNAASVSLATVQDSISVVSDGTNWHIVAVRGSALGL